MDAVPHRLAEQCGLHHGRVRWADTHTTANLKATCPISVSVLGPGVTLRHEVDCPHPCLGRIGCPIVHLQIGTIGGTGRRPYCEVTYGPAGEAERGLSDCGGSG